MGLARKLFLQRKEITSTRCDKCDVLLKLEEVKISLERGDFEGGALEEGEKIQRRMGYCPSCHIYYVDGKKFKEENRAVRAALVLHAVAGYFKRKKIESYTLQPI